MTVSTVARRLWSFHPENPICPYQPLSDILPKLGGVAWLLTVLFVKPDRTFDELIDSCLGDRQPRSAKKVAKKIDPSLDPADKGVVGVLFEASPRGGRPG